MNISKELIPISNFVIFKTDNGKSVCRYFRHTTPNLAIKGKVSALQAKLKAETEYDKHRVLQDRNYMSDFDAGSKKFLEIEIEPRKQDEDE